ncbi:polysaccharide deacetylase (plasmid) [Pararhizobium polonicum]|uniref:Polysaccharide deacetylase n=1 Tax=Pararhizobium polonicum TaxID=1612624 RepID=A0A1C7P8F9_9HYPH|nr:polysaccharide deacetylase [Pararhizobium polonicum]OBZ97575.1 polysaccharide deacetylase [Pararhizobium polonicum]
MTPLQPTGPDYLKTPMRRHAAMDHDFYAWRDSLSARRLCWPDGIRLGVWLQIAVEWFPLNIGDKPFLPIGAPSRPFPDSQTYTQRDYGNRVGIFRMMDALKARGLSGSAFLNARVAQRYPILMREILAEKWEVVAAGLDAGAIHHEGLSEEEERGMIAEALAIFGDFGVKPDVWHSPSWSQSTRTPRLLKEAGFTAMADWANDEAPYRFDTSAGTIVSLPTAIELSDREMLGLRKQALDDVEASFMAAARRLAREAEDSGHGRLLTLNLSPWIMGQPYRIAAFERILDAIFSVDGTRAVSAPEIIAATDDL